MRSEARDLSGLTEVLQDGRDAQLFSGAAYAVGTVESVLAVGAAGTTSWGSDVKVGPGTLWDIASITKPIVALGVMSLVGAGQVGLDEALGRLLADYRETDKAGITVAQLLTHSSGIPGQQPLYLTCPTGAELLNAVRSLPLRFAPGSGVEYTSQGFMVIGQVIEAVSGMSLAEVLRAQVLEPLGMRSTMFCPPASREPEVVATEVCPWRGRLVKGTVHDENAEVLGGVGGHAGLFSTTADLARVGRMMLGHGWLDGHQVFPEPLMAAMALPRTDHLNLRRCLGWQGADAEGCPVGSSVSAGSYGHTGFTGTSLWIDPAAGIYVVLLTNAVHPRRRPDSLKQFRPRFHDLALNLCA
jgi:CubicO group peptidase (beta-lactamase class C family)